MPSSQQVTVDQSRLGPGSPGSTDRAYVSGTNPWRPKAGAPSPKGLEITMVSSPSETLQQTLQQSAKRTVAHRHQPPAPLPDTPAGEAETVYSPGASPLLDPQYTTVGSRMQMNASVETVELPRPRIALP